MDTQKISPQNIFPTRSLSSANQVFRMYCLRLFSFIGLVSMSLEKNVKTAVENCCSFAVTRAVHVTILMLSPATKGLPHAPQKSSAI